MRKGKIAAYRRKSMVLGGLLGAGFGVVIGSMVGASLEAALTGFFGGLILGQFNRSDADGHAGDVAQEVSGIGEDGE